MWIADEQGRERPYAPIVVVCESATLGDLADGAEVTAAHRVFWHADGFAFGEPGRYRVGIAVAWSVGGRPVTAAAEVDVVVTEPATPADRAAADLVLDPEVGLWVALGGDAHHLTKAAERLDRLAAPEASRIGGVRVQPTCCPGGTMAARTPMILILLVIR